MDDTDSLAADNVHFRVGNDPYDPREQNYRTISIVIFLIDFITTLAFLAWFIQTIINGNDVVISLTNFIFSLLGLAFLGNGLYGSTHRGCSLATYVIAFEFIPAVFVSLVMLTSLFVFKVFREEVQKMITEQKLDISVGLAIAIIFIYYIILDAYHIFAGVMINRYRNICKGRDWEF